jgi:hypothetical protein
VTNSKSVGHQILAARNKEQTEANEMTNEELSKALRESWEKQGGKTVEIKEGEPTFDAKDFIESL